MLTLKIIKDIFNKKYTRVQLVFYTHLFSVLFFTIIYYLTSNYLLKDKITSNFDSFHKCFYLSLIIQSTLGYDRMIEEHRYIKNIQIIQMISIFILIPFI
jgi:hypothetical protein